MQLKITVPKQDSAQFIYEPLGYNFITSLPTLMDPYDQTYLYIADSL